MPSRARLLLLPYDSGHRDARMGRGPEALVRRGVVDRLRNRGLDVEVERITAGTAFPTEVATTFDLIARVAERVRQAHANGSIPVVLAGNCSSAIGTRARLGSGDIGVIWLDCHGDFNTPESTSSGFLDGMALATIAGRCWGRMVARVQGFRPVRGSHVLLVGARDYDPGEEERIAEAGIIVVHPRALRDAGVEAGLGPALMRLRSHVGEVYVHLDLDVLDPAEAPANEYQRSGGLSVAEVDAVLEVVSRQFVVRAFALTAYDPVYDPDGRTAAAALRFVEHVLMGSHEAAPPAAG